MTEARSFPTRAGGALFGPLVWAAHFLIVYASESLFCRLLSAHAHSWLLAVASVLALAAILGDLVAQGRMGRQESADAFIMRLRLGLDGLSGLAVLLVTMAGLALPACAG
jgi:hypothetical protein